MSNELLEAAKRIVELDIYLRDEATEDDGVNLALDAIAAAVKKVEKDPGTYGIIFDGEEVYPYEKLFDAFAGLVVCVNGDDYWCIGSTSDTVSGLIGCAFRPYTADETKMPDESMGVETVILDCEQIGTFHVY